MNRVTVISMGFVLILQAVSTPSTASFSVHITPAQQTVKAGTPINMDIIVKNDSSHDISVEQDNVVEAHYFVDVKNRDGARPKMTEHYGRVARILYPKRVGVAPGQNAISKEDSTEKKNEGISFDVYRGSNTPLRVLKPGQELRQSMRLNDLYGLDEVGTYTVQLKRMEGKTEIVSNVVIVTVTN